MALGILRNFDLGSHPVDSADSLHLQIEAMKLALSDAWLHVSDPMSSQVTPAQMLDDAYLASRAKLIDMKKAQTPAAGFQKGGGTIYLTAADEKGMMLSFIQSNYQGFGSGIVVPGTGISLQQSRPRLLACSPATRTRWLPASAPSTRSSRDFSPAMANR